MAAEKTRDPAKKFTFSARTRKLFWRRAADEKSVGHRATLLEMPHGEEEFFPKQHMFTGFANAMARDYEVGASSE